MMKNIQQVLPSGLAVSKRQDQQISEANQHLKKGELVQNIPKRISHTLESEFNSFIQFSTLVGQCSL